MKVILCAVDFSNNTPNVVDAAGKLARSVEGRIVLLTVVSAMPSGMTFDIALADGAELTRLAEEEADSRLIELKEQITREAIEVETRRFTGSAPEIIVEQAESLFADYIVMGSHGHTAIYDLLIGSTTKAVLKHSPCSVLVVPQCKMQAAEKMERAQVSAAATLASKR